MKYSIVMISMGRHELMLKALESIAATPYCPEIIVIEATDEKYEVNISGVKYFSIPTSDAGFSNQRNLGIQKAEGEYIIFTDDDIEITENWLQELTKITDDDPDVGGVMGAVYPLRPGIIGFCEGVLGHPGGGFKLHNVSKGRVISLNQLATCNTILHKKKMIDAGGFDPRNRYGSEDSDLTMRMTKKYGGGQFRYAPDAHVFHLPRNRLSKIIPWYFRRGLADAGLFMKGSTKWDYLLKTSVFLKLGVVVLMAALLKSYWIIGAAFLAWYIFQFWRTKYMFHYFKHYQFPAWKRWTTFLVFPAVKMLADLMLDVGRLKGFFVHDH